MCYNCPPVIKDLCHSSACLLFRLHMCYGIKRIKCEVGPAGLLFPSSGPGWRAEVRPSGHPVSDFDFDVVIGADGRKNTLDGERKN